MKVVVVIPAINVGTSIMSVITDIKDNNADASILVVDYGSSDQTTDVLFNNDIQYLSMPISSTYEKALKLGMRYALDNGFDAVVEYEGTGWMAGAGLSKMISHFPDNDIILANRYFDDVSINTRTRAERKMTKHILKASNKKITDPLFRFKIYNKRVFSMIVSEKIFWPSPDYISYIMKHDIRYCEVNVKVINMELSLDNLPLFTRYINYSRWKLAIKFIHKFRKVKKW